MATEVQRVFHIPDAVIGDDDVYLLYETRAPVKRGTSKADAINVEDVYIYPRRRSTKRVIDLSEKRLYFGDDVELLPSLPTSGTRLYRGESSNSKKGKVARSDIPLTFMCEICADEKPTKDSFRIQGCTHSYCSECIAKYISSRLQDNITNINCPVSECSGVLEPQQCRSVLPREVFDRWGDALCEAVILGSQKFYCPYKDCSAMLVDDGEESGSVVQCVCPHCNRLFCAGCKVPWHSGIACSEFQKLKVDERSDEDLMLMNLAKNNNWRRCGKCGFFVERESGCLFMTCRCKHTFCYHCGAPLKEHYCGNCKR